MRFNFKIWHMLRCTFLAVLLCGTQLAQGQWLGTTHSYRPDGESSRYSEAPRKRRAVARVPKRKSSKKYVAPRAPQNAPEETVPQETEPSPPQSATPPEAPQSSPPESPSEPADSEEVQPLDFKQMTPIISDAQCRFSSPFGMRKHPITGKRRMHQGCDIAAATGTPIRAPADGVVRHINDPYPGRKKGYGNVAWLQLGNGSRLRIAHLSRFGKNGKVKQGDVIGYVGSTGHSTGPHMHLELHDSRGRTTNPLNKFRISQLCSNIGSESYEAGGQE